ncbi:hypothetical protein [Flavobacterium lacus]|uniref:Methyltransferase family protein n=1 Tax=Flavobacterium lacus TaxID=1353778 RepID=A0A328WK30_9FLAO|nr:hypothetical protein [Flavobacterium lacus]RAR46601.1 hypothetical protein B0I10_1164 [Flavobacterium lacus]
MIKKIIALIKENKENQRHIIRQNEELIWANVFHDSIRDKSHLQNLSLNIGRWAGGYSFFYLLNRIMSDAKPQRILEFGLGESSKFISSCLEHDLKTGIHHIIEQSSDWDKAFKKRFTLSDFSNVSICPLVKKDVNGHEVNCYEGLTEIVSGKFDFYLVDGPFGSSHFSRYDILPLAERLTPTDDFIIIIDDYDRVGEKETAQSLVTLFAEKQIKVHIKHFVGVKKVWLLTTPKYRFLTSV